MRGLVDRGNGWQPAQRDQGVAAQRSVGTAIDKKGVLELAGAAETDGEAAVAAETRPERRPVASRRGKKRSKRSRSKAGAREAMLGIVQGTNVLSACSKGPPRRRHEQLDFFAASLERVGRPAIRSARRNPPGPVVLAGRPARFRKLRRTSGCASMTATAPTVP